VAGCVSGLRVLLHHESRRYLGHAGRQTSRRKTRCRMATSSSP